MDKIIRIFENPNIDYYLMGKNYFIHRRNK